jgi:hypothetical protein
MELYLSIALGIVLGELGKELLYRIQNLWWSFKNRNKIKPDFFKWDDTEELLNK